MSKHTLYSFMIIIAGIIAIMLLLLMDQHFKEKALSAELTPSPIVVGTCFDTDKAKRVGRGVFRRKFPDVEIRQIARWQYQRDDIHFFSIIYRDKQGYTTQGAVAVAKETCKTVVMRTFDVE